MKRALLALMLLAACRRDMVDRPARRPLGSTPFFDDRNASRPLVADVVPRGAPQRVASIEHGREQYEIFCQPCHGAHGEGNGVIVRHGFPRPPALAGKTWNEVIGAIEFGKGAMYSVPEADAQSIAAYIETLRWR